MADYWKSTPKYWCKFCEVFVRDTKIEKQQHEATGKHQGAVQRSLRNLHKDKEREERDKQRAKDEVARLNGLVSGSLSGPTTLNTTKSTMASAGPRQRTAQDVRQNNIALASMGVILPGGYDGDTAIAGEWQTVPRATGTRSTVVTKEDAPTLPPCKSKSKRKADIDDEEDIHASVQKKRWAAAVKAVHEFDSHSDNLDALFPAHNMQFETESPKIKQDPDTKLETASEAEHIGGPAYEPTDAVEKAGRHFKEEIESPAGLSPPMPNITFKKRRTKFKSK